MLKESNHYGVWILAVLVTGVSLVATINAQQNKPGLIVEEVVADSPAAKAGIRIGDRLLTYDNKELISPAAFLALQENTFGKKEVELSVRRKEETLNFKVSIGALGIKVRPELSSAALKLYEEGRAALQAQKSDEAIARLKEAAKVSAGCGRKVSSGMAVRASGRTLRRSEAVEGSDNRIRGGFGIVEREQGSGSKVTNYVCVRTLQTKHQRLWCCWSMARTSTASGPGGRKRNVGCR